MSRRTKRQNLKLKNPTFKTLKQRKQASEYDTWDQYLLDATDPEIETDGAGAATVRLADQQIDAIVDRTASRVVERVKELLWELRGT